MNSLQNSVPKLRFEEFSNDWEIKKIGSISTEIMYGIGASSTKYDGENKYLRITDINKETRKFIPNPLTSPNGIVDKKYYLKKDEIVFARTGASVGKSYLYNTNDGNLVFAGYLIKILINSENSSFVFQHTLRDSYKKWVETMSMRSGQPGLNAEEYKSLKFYYPSIQEQQKIASFLTAIDKKLTQLQEKKNGLEDYKKGAMQQVFSQELRFRDKDGNNYSNWEEKKLGDIGVTLNGLTGKTKENFGIGKPYIQYKQIFDSSKIDISNCGLVDISKNEKQTKVQFGDVFFTTSSETPNEIGTASVLLDKVDDMYLNSFCFGYRVDLKILVPKFSQFLFRSNDFRRKMIPLAQGSTRYNISKSSFVKLMVDIPSTEEQTQIANFLSAIDKKIQLVNTQIENTQQFKKGLLQQMFV